MKLPRGTADEPSTAPTATARWASPPEILAYRYKPGDIYLGDTFAAPAAAVKVIEALDAFIEQVAADSSLEATWSTSQVSRARQLRDWLVAFERVPIGIDDDRHLITIAGSRSGKGTSAIIPNLCMWPSSVVVIDPKGSNARQTATRRGPGSAWCRGMGQKTLVLDPYRISGVAKELRAAFNPLERLSPDSFEIIDEASSLAQGLIVRGGDESAHFDDTARSLVKALILYVVLNAPEGRRTLPYVHTLLTQGAREQMEADRGSPLPESGEPDPFRYLLYLMESEKRLDGVIAGIAATLLDMGEREYGSVLSTARRNLEFLERPGIREVLSHSTFSLDELKTAEKGVTIYLCLPVTRFDDCSRWLRLMIAAALERIYAIPGQPRCGYPILFLLEEFATLKHMEVIETAAGYAAEFGVKLWAILQDISQLRRNYREGWESFLGNASVVQAFGNSDMTTLDYLSRKLGETETVQVTRNTTSSRSISSNDAGDAVRLEKMMRLNPLSLLPDQRGVGESATTTTAFNQQLQRSPLMQTNEIEQVFRREEMTEIVSIKGERPFALHRQAFYDSPDFAGLFEPDHEPYRTIEQAEQWRTQDEMDRARTLTRLIGDAERFMAEVTAAIDAAKTKRR